MTFALISSSKDLPQIDSPPVPSPSGSPVCNCHTRHQYHSQLRIITAHHEFLDDSMEDNAFVVCRPCMTDEILDGFRRYVRKQVKVDVAFSRMQGRLSSESLRLIGARCRYACDCGFFSRRLLVEYVTFRFRVTVQRETTLAFGVGHDRAETHLSGSICENM